MFKAIVIIISFKMIMIVIHVNFLLNDLHSKLLNGVYFAKVVFVCILILQSVNYSIFLLVDKLKIYDSNHIWIPIK